MTIMATGSCTAPSILAESDARGVLARRASEEFLGVCDDGVACDPGCIPARLARSACLALITGDIAQAYLHAQHGHTACTACRTAPKDGCPLARQIQNVVTDLEQIMRLNRALDRHRHQTTWQAA